MAVGQTDEIQVYDAEIAEPGVFNLMLHTNYTPIGRKTPDFPGAIIANHSVNGAWEWAYGVTDWLEQGLYLPVWSPHSEDHGSRRWKRGRKRLLSRRWFACPHSPHAVTGLPARNSRAAQKLPLT
jgi:hypothetical protein